MAEGLINGRYINTEMILKALNLQASSQESGQYLLDNALEKGDIYSYLQQRNCQCREKTDSDIKSIMPDSVYLPNHLRLLTIDTSSPVSHHKVLEISYNDTFIECLS